MGAQTNVLAVFGWPLLPVDRLDPTTSERAVARAVGLMRGSSRYDLALFSGGIFLPPAVQTRPWGEIARDAAVAAGTDPHQTLVETASLDTYDNIRYSLGVLEKAGIRYFSLTVCTHRIHGRRVRHTAKVLYGMNIRIEPVEMPLTPGERIWQWGCVAYHYWDKSGSGWYRRRMLRRRAQIVRAIP